MTHNYEAARTVTVLLILDFMNKYARRHNNCFMQSVYNKINAQFGLYDVDSKSKGN
jgi:hypothetical protein